MRRVLPLLAIAVAVAVAVMVTSAFAQTNCSQEIAALRSRIATLNDPAKQQELELLLAKAQNDNDAGHANLCADDLRHAQQLVK